MAYSNHDQSINLLDKGMSQVIAAVVHHCKGDEVSTFWILVSLVENYDMRKFFQPGLPGIALYGECLDLLIQRHLPEVAAVFKKLNISYFDFFEGWIHELFTSHIPLSLLQDFISKFLKDGWGFFFRVCLTVLLSLQKHIIQKSQQKHQVLMILNFQQDPRDLDVSAMENFKDLNERGSSDSPSDNGENFPDIHDDIKPFGKNLELQRSSMTRLKAQKQEEKKKNVTNIVVHRQRQTETSNEQPEKGGFFSTFKNLMDQMGLGEQRDSQRAHDVEVQRIQALLANPKDLTVDDFNSRAVESWKYIMDISNYRWVFQGQGYEDIQMINSQLIQDLLQDNYNNALKRFLENERQTQELEKQQMVNKLKNQKPEKESPKFPSPGLSKEPSNGSVVQFDALNSTKGVPLLSKKLGQFPSGLAAGYGAGNPLLQRGSDISYAAARTSAIGGVTMDLGYNPNTDKSAIPHLHALFNEGDVSMMDEMNRLMTGFQSRNRDSLKDQNSDNRSQPLSQPFSKEGSGKSATRKLSPIVANPAPQENPRLSDERFSNIKFQQSAIGNADKSMARNTLIKTFNAGHLDLEGEIPQLGGNCITPSKGKALGTTAFGIAADDISRIQATDGDRFGFNADPNESLQNCLNVYNKSSQIEATKNGKTRYSSGSGSSGENAASRQAEGESQNLIKQEKSIALINKFTEQFKINLEKVDTESAKKSKVHNNMLTDDGISAIICDNGNKYPNEEASFVEAKDQEMDDKANLSGSCTHITTGERKNMQAMILNRSPYIQENITPESNYDARNQTPVREVKQYDSFGMTQVGPNQNQHQPLHQAYQAFQAVPSDDNKHKIQFMPPARKNNYFQNNLENVSLNSSHRRKEIATPLKLLQQEKAIPQNLDNKWKDHVNDAVNESYRSKVVPKQLPNQMLDDNDGRDETPVMMNHSYQRSNKDASRDQINRSSRYNDQVSEQQQRINAMGGLWSSQGFNLADAVQRNSQEQNLIRGTRREITDVQIRSPTTRSPQKPEKEEIVKENYYKVQPTRLNLETIEAQVNESALNKSKSNRINLDLHELGGYKVEPHLSYRQTDNSIDKHQRDVTPQMFSNRSPAFNKVNSSGNLHNSLTNAHLAQSTNSQSNMVCMSLDAAANMVHIKDDGSNRNSQAPARTQMTAKALAIREKVLQMQGIRKQRSTNNSACSFGNNKTQKNFDAVDRLAREDDSQTRNPQSLISSPFTPQYGRSNINDFQNTAKTIKPYNNECVAILDSAITKQYKDRPLNENEKPIQKAITAFEFEPKPRKSLSQQREDNYNQSPQVYQDRNSNGDSNKKSGSGESKVSEKNMTKATMNTGTEADNSKVFNSGSKIQEKSHLRTHSADLGPNLHGQDPKASKKKAVQDFIQNAKKNKFSDWRRQRVSFQSNQSSDMVRVKTDAEALIKKYQNQQ